MIITRTLMITAIIAILMTGLAFSSSYVFAEKPDSQYPISGNCTFSGPSSDEIQTCCWREKIPGKILGERYCQSCKWVEGQGWVNCTKRNYKCLIYRQILYHPHHLVLRPPYKMMESLNKRTIQIKVVL